MSLPFRGPALVPSHDEVALIHRLLTATPNAEPLASGLVLKCERSLASDPRFRKPTT